MSRIMKVMSLLVALLVFAGSPPTAGAQTAGEVGQPNPSGPKPKAAPVKDKIVTPGGTVDAGAGTGAEKSGNAASTELDPPALSLIEPYVRLHRDRAKLVEDYATQLWAVCSDATGFGDYEAIKRAAAGTKITAPPSPREADFKTFKDDVCARLCAPAHGAPGFDFCALSDKAAANSAVIADWDSAALVIRYVNQQLEKVRQKRPDLFKFAEDNGLEAAVPFSGLQMARKRSGEKLEAGLGVASLATISADALRVGLSALARVIVDRAKRESIGFFLERMGKSLCDGDAKESDSAGEKKKKEEAAREVRTYWFPATCMLAADRGSYLLQYGGGARLLGALRAAVESDLSGWPGAAASLVLGQVFLGAPDKSCGSEDKTVKCGAYRELRAATQRLLSDLLSGKNYAAALNEFGASFDALNHQASGARFNTSLQVAACAASMPLYLEQYGGALSAELGSAEGARSILIAGFSSAPACWSLFGQGINRKTCDLFGGSDKQCPSNLPRPATGALERLSTVVRLHGVIGRAAHSVGQRLALLQGALKQYEAALQAPVVLSPASQVTLPKVEITSAESAGAALSALEGFARSMDGLAELRAYQRRIAAAAAVASASLSLADSALVAIGETPPELMPALAKTKAEQLRTWVVEARASLSSIQRGVDSVAAIARQDWGFAAARALALLRVDATKQCAEGACARVQELWGRFAPVLVAVVTERDPDAVAEAIEQAASPPGGWKRKGVRDTFMFSVASHAGIMGGVELRHGQYGVVRENFEKAYGVAPTVMLPVGFDFTWGNDGGVNPVGLFVSLIDPLAFLQYDVSEDGRLPGPSLTTVLAPGLSLRLGIDDTPFSLLLPHVVYRPGLRAWDPEIAGPAASALQVGAGLAVDVTLIDIVVKP